MGAGLWIDRACQRSGNKILVGAHITGTNWRVPWWATPDGSYPYRRAIVAVMAVYFICHFFNSMAPESSFDRSAYHLSLGATPAYLMDRNDLPLLRRAVAR
jgi:hypothetical protein